MNVLVAYASRHGSTRGIADFRDWDAIDAWATEIAAELTATQMVTTTFPRARPAST